MAPLFLASIPTVVAAGAPDVGGREIPRTERVLLSGADVDEPTHWEFRCTSGRRCLGEGDRDDDSSWSRIAVPAQWQQEGFGVYHYGHDEDKTPTVGYYRTRFEVPAGWSNRRIELVFEGVMTDAEVRIDGELAGSTHRGGFTQFRYDVTGRVRPGDSHTLDVEVAEVSSDRSIELAERDADYWVFGGIYRPVYLESRPPEAITHVAVDARADGELRMVVEVAGLEAEAEVRARVERRGESGLDEGQDGTIQSEVPFRATVGPDPTSAIARVDLGGRISGARPWSAEDPALYRLVLELVRGDGILHRETRPIGFRTLEWPPGQGLRVNGDRVVLEGINRHAFWPDTGRASSRARDLADLRALRELGANAVRSSHYPPDQWFLEAADELGLYVLNELPGWHDAYSTKEGRRLVREMVRRDVHHPSVIAWVNGNEGGSNASLDEEFAAHDPQKRLVFHSDTMRHGLDSMHYLTWDEVGHRLEPGPVDSLRGWGENTLLFTEFLHGLYDGGSGAGLGEWWERLHDQPRFAGAFLWAFTDESVERTDRGNELDSDGNHAPDGVLGPYREPTGTSRAVREIWAPVQFLGPPSGGRLPVRNRWSHLDLSRARFEWRWLAVPTPGSTEPARVIEEGGSVGPSARPSEKAWLSVGGEPTGADVFEVVARAPTGEEVARRGWILTDVDSLMGRGGSRSTESSTAAAASTSRSVSHEGWVVLRAGDLEVGIDVEHGRLRLTRVNGGMGGETVELDGPLDPLGDRRPVTASRKTPGRRGEALEMSVDGGRILFEVVDPGWLRMSWLLDWPSGAEVRGLGFRLPEAAVQEMEWWGSGPTPVWRNRPEGGDLGRWSRRVEGKGDSLPGDGSRLGGFYRGVVWGRLDLGKVDLVVLPGEQAVAFPEFDFGTDPQDAVAQVPTLDVTFASSISAIGTKFHPAEAISPAGRPLPPGLDRGEIWLRPGGAGSSGLRP